MHNASIWSIMRLVPLVVLVLIVAVACSETEPERVDNGGEDSAASEGGESEGGDESAAAAEAEDSDESAESEDGDDGELEEAEGFAVGDTVRMGELVMDLHAVRWDEGGEFTGPDEGMRWLIADIEITNEADSATSISSLMMFDLIDEDNRSRDLAIMADTQGSLDGELGGGRSMRGDLAWEVAEGQTSWELVFSPELFGFGQAIYEISEDDF